MTMRRRLPAWVHRAWAWTLGYFWRPCAECGQMFGGHEAARDGASVDGRIVCRRCGPKVTARNMAEIEKRLGLRHLGPEL